VSHDEEFLRSVVDHTWAVVGGTVRAAAHYDPRLLEVRHAKPAPPARVGQPAKATPVQSTTPEKKPMSKNERFRAEKRKEAAEEVLARLSSEREAMERRFADPDAVFGEDWRALHDRFEKLKGELSSAEEEWLEAVTALDEDDALRGEGG
jgi:hypothetical protein